MILRKLVNNSLRAMFAWTKHPSYESFLTEVVTLPIIVLANEQSIAYSKVLYKPFAGYISFTDGVPKEIAESLYEYLDSAEMRNCLITKMPAVNKARKAKLRGKPTNE